MTTTSEVININYIMIQNKKKQGSEQLEEVITKTKEINDVDFKRMIRDFETSARHEDILKKIKKKHMSESKKYQETIKHMKELKEETYQKKNEELKQKLKKKEMVLITALETKQKDKMEEKRRIITEMIEKENRAKKIIQEFMTEQERIRLQFEENINKKSK